MALLASDRTRDAAEILAKITRWFTLCIGILTAILGIVVVCTRDASLSVISNKFASDKTNQESWRMALFSFTPVVFIDAWTPLAMGIITILVNFQSFHCTTLTQNFARMFIWVFLVSMFGNLGYAGGVGIIFGSFSMLDAVFCLVTALLHDGPACLELEFSKKFTITDRSSEVKSGTADV